MKIDRKSLPATPGNLTSIREIITSRLLKAKSIIISPASLYRQQYTFNLTFLSNNGKDTQQLREPFEAAAKLFRNVEKIVIQAGAKPEDIAALFSRLNDARLPLNAFSRPKIEIVFRPQRSDQFQPATPQPAKPGPKQAEPAAPVSQPSPPRPDVEKSTPAAQTKPAHSDPDAFPRPKEGFIDGLRITVAGFIGNYVRFSGEKGMEFIPIQLSHSDRLEWSPVIDTGIVLNHQYRALRIHCTKDFLEITAPLLLKAIADGQNFIFDMHYYSSPEEKLVCAQQHIGPYTPRGVMPAGTFKLLREQYNDAFGCFPFRLTIEGFSQKWTVRDLVRAMAQKHLTAVAIEKEPETAVTQPANPARPISCNKLGYLRVTCAKIFEIWHASGFGELNSPERKERIRTLSAGEDIRPWLEQLNSGGAAALTAAYPEEYQEGLRITRNPDYYPNLIKSALDILDQVYEKV